VLGHADLGNDTDVSCSQVVSISLSAGIIKIKFAQALPGVHAADGVSCHHPSLAIPLFRGKCCHAVASPWYQATWKLSLRRSVKGPW